jgi:hypothetical protein|tara:strand:+ start:1186 stop:1605 length:420 start_codon:yes stop_codon:yes gene_type:complete
MKWFIPGNVPSSKNGKRWTGKYLISSKTVMKYRKDTANAYKKHAKSFIKELSKHELPVKISFKFFRGSRHKFDYINPAQTVQDDMVKHGWIEDDNMTFIIPSFEEYEYNKENPGVEIKIIKNEKTKSKTKDRVKKTKRS